MHVFAFFISPFQLLAVWLMFPKTHSGRIEFFVFVFREEKWEIWGNEFFDFSFFTFLISVNKKTYKMYSAHISQTLIMLQNVFCTFLSNTPIRFKIYSDHSSKRKKAKKHKMKSWKWSSQTPSSINPLLLDNGYN